MSAASAAAEPAGARTWRKPPFIESTLLRRGLLLLTIVYLIAAFGSLDVNWERVYLGLERGWKFIVAFSRPDFISRWTDMRDGMIESIIMTVTSTVVGVLISIPIGLGAARNIAPLPVYLVARGIIVLSRTLHEVIIAIIFVKIFGFGPLAGVLTLIVASFSFIAKMLAEDIENMVPGPTEAIRATGASFPKLLIYAITPQILPRYLGVSIYRLDANLRHSTVVGIVGAGGIGKVLQASFNRYDYDFSLAILITIVSLVFLGEIFSNWIRGRLR